MFNDLPSSRRGHLLVVSFIFFVFFLHSFVLFFFCQFLFGDKFEIWGLFVHMYLFFVFFL